MNPHTPTPAMLPLRYSPQPRRAAARHPPCLPLSLCRPRKREATLYAIDCSIFFQRQRRRAMALFTSPQIFRQMLASYAAAAMAPSNGQRRAWCSRCADGFDMLRCAAARRPANHKMDAEISAERCC